MTRRRHLLACLAPAALLLGAGPAAVVGPFSDGTLTVDLSPAAGGYAGRITRGGQTFAATAHVDGDRLQGTFDAAGQRFPFTETIAGDTATFATGGRTYTLRRPAAISPADAHAWRVKRTTLTDAFMADQPGEAGPNAVTLLVPDGWSAKCHGWMPEKHDVNFAGPRLFISADDPAGTTGLRILPGRATFWSNDPGFRQFLQSVDQSSPMTLSDPLLPTRSWDAAVAKLAVDPAGVLKDPRAIGRPELVPGAEAALAPILERVNATLADAARQSRTVDRVHAVGVHVVREPRRAADAADEDDVLLGHPQLGHEPLHGGQDGVVPAAGAPAHLLVGLEVLGLQAQIPGSTRGGVGHEWITPFSISASSSALNGNPRTWVTLRASTRYFARISVASWPRFISGMTTFS